MRYRSVTTGYAIVAIFTFGQGSTVNAGPSSKVDTGTDHAAGADAEEPLPPAASHANTGVTLSSPMLRQQVLLGPNTARIVKASQPVAEINISNPSVVDGKPITDRRVVLVAGQQGKSDVIFFDKDHTVISYLEVTVDDFATRGYPVSDPEGSAYRVVEVHNKAKLDSQTNFRCGSDGCHFAGEVTVSEPAPLPSGYSNNTSSNHKDAAPADATTPKGPSNP